MLRIIGSEREQNIFNLMIMLSTETNDGAWSYQETPSEHQQTAFGKTAQLRRAANCNGEETAKINHNFPAGPPQKSSRSIWVYCAVAISWAGCNYSIYFRLYTTKIRALPFTTLIEQNWIYYSGNCSKLYISLPSFITFVHLTPPDLDECKFILWS